VCIKLSSTHTTERGCCADWFGKGTHNTTSFTPFKGAYMHYYIVLIHPDSQTLQATATDLEHILEYYTTHFYAYDNLSSDPEPGMCFAPYAVRLTLAFCHAEMRQLQTSGFCLHAHRHSFLSIGISLTSLPSHQHPTRCLITDCWYQSHHQGQLLSQPTQTSIYHTLFVVSHIYVGMHKNDWLARLEDTATCTIYGVSKVCWTLTTCLKIINYRA